VTFRVQRVVSARDVWVVDEATANGVDPGGRRVRATDRAAVTLVAPTATDTPRSGGGGTAFTGAPIALPLTATTVLALLGASALLMARRRRA
jgi:hypothetical protein